MNTKIIASLAGILAISVTAIQAKTFDFKDPKGVNNIAFSMDAPLEYISGTGNGISGSVTFDPEQPASTAGTIVLETSSLMVANALMREHMLGEGWLNVEKYPTITFEAQELSHVEQQKNVTQAHVTGVLTVKDVSKTVTFPVSFTYLPGALSDRSNGAMEGDLMVLRSTFSILRSDYGINAGQNEDKVSNEIELRLSIAGAAAK